MCGSDKPIDKSCIAFGLRRSLLRRLSYYYASSKFGGDLSEFGACILLVIVTLTATRRTRRAWVGPLRRQVAANRVLHFRRMPRSLRINVDQQPRLQNVTYQYQHGSFGQPEALGSVRLPYHPGRPKSYITITVVNSLEIYCLRFQFE